MLISHHSFRRTPHAASCLALAALILLLTACASGQKDITPSPREGQKDYSTPVSSVSRQASPLPADSLERSPGSSVSTIQGVRPLGYAPAAPASSPSSGYGSGPTDFAKGYEGLSGPHDTWGRESDLKARDSYARQGAQPASSAPPAISARPATGGSSLPSLPKPPLP